MGKLTENTIIALAKKLGTTTTLPARLSDLRCALYGGTGRVTDEIKYLGKSKAKLSDAWVTKTNIKSSLNEVKNVFLSATGF